MLFLFHVTIAVEAISVSYCETLFYFSDKPARLEGDAVHLL